jgi:serine/threonine protein kinase
MREYQLAGKQLGPYRLLQGIGRGGMAEVYLAEDHRLDRKVAIKILPAAMAQEGDFKARFEREARAAARLQHPHILPVFDYGQQDGLTYLVMPYIAGGSLDQRMKNTRGPLALNQIVQWTEEMASALQFAHDQGIIHRDVKPGNMLMSSGDHLLLSDFGIAKVVDANTSLTNTGVTVGSPEYMAPEQAGGDADHRSDIYSLGIVVYKMLTGQVPFSASTPMQVMFRHVQEPPPAPRVHNPAISPQMEAVVLQALAKRPEQRFQSASALAAALKSTANAGTPPLANPGFYNQPASGPSAFYPQAPNPMPAPPMYPAQSPSGPPAYPPPTAFNQPVSSYNQAVPPSLATYESTLYEPSRPPPDARGAWASQPPPQVSPVQVYPGRAPQPSPTRKSGKGIVIAILVVSLVIAATLSGIIYYTGSHRSNAGQTQQTPTARAGSTPTTIPTTIPLLYNVTNPACDDASLWSRNQVAQDNVSCKSDGLYLSRPTTTDFTSSIFLQSYPKEPSSGFPADYRLEVDTTLSVLDPSQTSNDLTGFGIIFRNQTGHGGYFFMVDPVAGAWLFKIEDAQGNPFKMQRDVSSAIQTGQGAKNHLRVDVKGDQFVGYVNGVQVGSASDSSFSGGNVGLVVAFKGMTVVYTNFVIAPID